MDQEDKNTDTAIYVKYTFSNALLHVGTTK